MKEELTQAELEALAQKLSDELEKMFDESMARADEVWESYEGDGR